MPGAIALPDRLYRSSIAEYFSTYLMAYIGQSSVLTYVRTAQSHSFNRHPSSNDTDELPGVASDLCGSDRSGGDYTLRTCSERIYADSFLDGVVLCELAPDLGSLLIAPPVAGLTMRRQITA